MNIYEQTIVKFIYGSSPFISNNDNKKTEDVFKMVCDITVDDKDNWSRVHIKTRNTKTIKLYKNSKWDIEFLTHYVNGETCSTIKLSQCRIEKITHHQSGKSQCYKFDIFPDEVIIKNTKKT
ncbi:hypothetical protein OI904_08435 [Citrobacter freundii]|nr:hypothetical protein OI904_08435 [Citrobacter freundii]